MLLYVYFVTCIYAESAINNKLKQPPNIINSFRRNKKRMYWRPKSNGYFSAKQNLWSKATNYQLLMTNYPNISFSCEKGQRLKWELVDLETTSDFKLLDIQILGIFSSSTRVLEISKYLLWSVYCFIRRKLI